MQLSWISDGRSKIVAIVGICKNAGKTTVLNAVLDQHSFNWGVLSTGRDGETEDLLFKTPKPRVKIPQGSLFCCDRANLEEHGSRVSILSKVNRHSGNRSLWLLKAETDLETELTGPGTSEAQLACAKQLLDMGAEKVIIDGSLDRKSIVLDSAIDGIILVAGASFGSVEAITSELRRLLILSGIKKLNSGKADAKQLGGKHEIIIKQAGKWKSSGLASLFSHEKQLIELLSTNPDAIYIPGAYSSSAHHRLSSHFGQAQLIFRHPECLKLDRNELASFLVNHDVSCLIPFPIKAIALNAKGVGSNDLASDELLMQIRDSLPKLPVFDVMELNEQ